jgi:hypothetical protein
MKRHARGFHSPDNEEGRESLRTQAGRVWRHGDPPKGSTTRPGTRCCKRQKHVVIIKCYEDQIYAKAEHRLPKPYLTLRPNVGHTDPIGHAAGAPIPTMEQNDLQDATHTMTIHGKHQSTFESHQMA